MTGSSGKGVVSRQKTVKVKRIRAPTADRGVSFPFGSRYARKDCGRPARLSTGFQPGDFRGARAGDYLRDAEAAGGDFERASSLRGRRRGAYRSRSLRKRA
jgi:hypothetical protein